MRVEDAERKAKVKAILTQFWSVPMQQEQEQEKSAVRLGKRKTAALDDEEEDSEMLVPEGSVSTRVCLGLYIY